MSKKAQARSVIGLVLIIAGVVVVVLGIVSFGHSWVTNVTDIVGGLLAGAGVVLSGVIRRHGS